MIIGCLGLLFIVLLNVAWSLVLIPFVLMKVLAMLGIAVSFLGCVLIMMLIYAVIGLIKA